jgi:hypothetical protein
MRPQANNAETQHETNDETNEWLTVANAARILGVSKQAIRQRIYRDTIPHSKAPDGTVFVRITETNAETNSENNGENNAESCGSAEPSEASRELVEELRDRIGFLERQLEIEQRAHAELRRLLAGTLERIPALEERSPDPPEVPVRASEEQSNGENEEAPPEPDKRPWWRKLLGE